MLNFRFLRRPALNVEQALRKSHAFVQQGRPGDAEPLCRAILKSQPNHFDSLHLLGVIKLQQGNFDEAEGFFAEALRSSPNSADALANRGKALLGLNRPHDALECFEKVLAISPNSADACFNHAAVLQSLGRHDEAIAGYAQALVIQPQHIDSLSGLGHSLEAQDRIDDALAACESALAVRPDNPAVLNDRANALFKLGRHAEAMTDWERALAVDPRFVAALMSRGNALHMLGRSGDALAEYDKAIELLPDDPGAPYNRGVVLHALGRRDEAVAAYDWAIAIKPDHVQALHNRGILQSERNRHDEALASYEQLLAVDPDYPHVAGNVAFERAQLCLWDDRDRVMQRVEDGVRLGRPVSVPFTFLALSQKPEAQLACATSHVASRHPASRHPQWIGEIYKHGRIRVAYLSADFHEHALAFLIAGLLEQHDHERFETTGIVFGPDIRSPMRARIEASFDRFIDVRSKSDAEVAKVMRELEIDIAVDLMGFSGYSRAGIFACRPAPVQVNYLGYPGTMGADYMDYILADRFLIPEAQRIHYAEKVVYLPDTFQANDAKRRIADATPSRAAVGLPQEGFVFCSFNSIYKITPEMFTVWMRLLRQLPDSVLWLIGGNASMQANLRREAQYRDVAPTRLVFAPRLPYAEHLARFRLADLFLDTLPFNGGATASDSLWAGLPVLTCSGEAYAARMAGSLLHAIGLLELITHTLAEYESLALQLATDAPRLSVIRQRLARNRNTFPLFDTDRFRRNVEAAYVTMWEKSQRGEGPCSFAVPG